jgi:DNA-binding transcriptional LysR family regulator
LTRLALPGEGTAVRTRLLHWLRAQRIQPRIVGEFDDSALMKTFGRAGAGVFIAPSVIASEVARQYGAGVIGETDDVRERGGKGFPPYESIIWKARWSFRAPSAAGRRGLKAPLIRARYA